MEKKMVIMMGIQGSGKSTFCHKYLKDDYAGGNACKCCRFADPL